MTHTQRSVPAGAARPKSWLREVNKLIYSAEEPDMRRAATGSVAALMGITFLATIACETQPDASSTAEKSPPAVAAQSSPQDLHRGPINVAPLLIQDPRDEPTEGFVFVQESLARKPPFFNGSPPVEFKARMGAGGLNGSLVIYGMTFHSFRNVFMYLADSIYTGIPFGGVSYDNNGVRRAEAKLIDSNNGNGSLVIEELHYSVDRKPIFHCKSNISLMTGFKKSEFATEGVKEKDYYFIWPVRPH